jgi:putative hydrolase of the HAD superfamily
MKLDNIEAILFDSGRVLNVPKSGHWFISPGFYSQINRRAFEKIGKNRINIAFSKAGNYINSISVITSKEEEYTHFLKYYTIFSEELPELGLTESKIAELAKDLVYNTEKYLFFEDALTIIPELSKKYKLAVVSDAWPSLKDVFMKADLYKYFSSFIISSYLGVTKPNEKMYLTALTELRITPQKALFIDDNVNNCLGAVKIGINAVLLCRNKKRFILQKILSVSKGYRVIYSLKELI